jgi:hypothetical protein
MPKLFAASLASIALATAPSVALAGSGNPSGTGQPMQSCQTLQPNGASTVGKAQFSPGSPFNEAIINSPLGGTGGQHYSTNSQYDVACYGWCNRVW